jgi:methylenetetrahydrofolate reductase (NADPH)
VADEFYLFARDEQSGLADPERLNPVYEASLARRQSNRNVTLTYRFSKWVHDLVFTPGRALYKLGRRIYGSSKKPEQGPALLRIVEHASKSAMFGCKDCGDCSLPDIAYLCPESQCAKNQRNGPCGGTREGKCEVEDFECIWSRAYDRLKYEGREQDLLSHAPVIQDETLRGTSSWSNSLLEKDHVARKRAAALVQQDKPTAEGASSKSDSATGGGSSSKEYLPESESASNVSYTVERSETSAGRD